MPRFVAFLRGVSPMNCKMPELKAAFEAGGFTEVRTLLSSGNVVFDARNARSIDALQQRAEAAMAEAMGKTFAAIVRRAEDLQQLVDANPFAEFDLPAQAKPIITFLRAPARAKLDLPLQQDGASILKLQGLEVFSAYLPTDKGPVFMSLLERSFGKEITTRTLDTVRKCAWA
jgi:uncharacterized protein (DUF1697 family)